MSIISKDYPFFFQSIIFFILYKQTQSVLPGAIVQLLNLPIQKSAISNENGKFTFKSKPDQQYTFLIGSGDHEPLAVDFNTLGVKKSEVMDKNFTLEETMVSFDLNVTDRETAYPVSVASVELKNIETDFLNHFNEFYNSEELRTCKNCGEVLQKP